MDIYSDELKYLFCERVHHETNELGRHFIGIVRSSFEKLCISHHWESLQKMFVCDPFVYEFYKKDGRRSFIDFGKELAEKVEVSPDNLSNYITIVDQFLSLASNMYFFLHEHENLVNDITFFLSNSEIPGFPHRARLGWEALHTVTLLKRGSLSNGDIYREQHIFQSFSHKVSEEHLLEAKKKDKLPSPNEGQNENVKILEGIIEDLKKITDSEIQLDADAEENRLMVKIWNNVASSVHFFLCAMAFEQKYLVMGCHALPSASMLGIRKATKKKNCLPNVDKFDDKASKLVLDARNLKFFLDSYKTGLLRKL